MSATRDNKDALNVTDSTRSIVFKRVNELINIHELPSIFSTNTFGTSRIYGSSIHGVYGSATYTYGARGRTSTVVGISCPNNTFYEFFSTTRMQDSSGANTAYWDTTNLRLAMSSSSNHSVVYNTSMDLRLSYNNGTFSNATLSCVETKFGNDSIKYFLKAGGNWEEATNGTKLSFGTAGSDVRLHVVFLGNGGSSTYIEDLKVVLS